MATVERVVCNSVAQNVVLLRISRLQEQLHENDITARDDELLARGIDEFLLLREYRKRQMQKISAKVEAILTPSRSEAHEQSSSDNKSR